MTATKTRILLVEDDATAAKTLSTLLRRLGYNVAHAPTLADAFGKLGRRPCCIFLDLMLPDGNGIDLLRRVRDEKLAISVAVTTGTHDDGLMSRVKQLAPDAVFTKPLRLTELMDWLHAATRPSG